MSKKFLPFLIIGFLFLLPIQAYALSVDVNPVQDSTTSIENQDCGEVTSTEYTITNNGWGGVLCWYWTSDDPTIHKLTTSCIGVDETETYDAYINMPLSGSKTLDLQLECYDFWDLIHGDECIDSTTISEARNDHYTGGAEGVMAERHYSLNCEQLQFSVVPSKSIVSLFSGESKTVDIIVTNQMTSSSITCDHGIGSISPDGSNNNYKITITAPSTGSGTSTQTATVTCTWSGGTSSTKEAIITVNYQPDPCISALNNAASAINDAQSSISGAQSKINEASNLGAEVTDAQSYLNNANSYLSTAQTSYSSAQSSCNSGDRTNGVSQANSAQSSATQAKSSATQALNEAQQTIQRLSQEKIDASNAISSAKSSIDDAKKRIEDAEGLINNATIIGMDTTSAEGNVATARSKLESAEDYHSEASSNFNSGNYDLAEQKADSAESYSSEAESLASSAYNSLWTTYSKKRVGAQAILDASGSISQMNEIMTKMDYVLRNLRDYNVDLTATQSVTDNAKTSVDSSEDLFSQAKNKMEAGYTDESVNLAVQAKSSADSAKNRLDTMVTELKFSMLDGLEAAYNEKEGKVSTARSEVKSAEGTYGTDSEIVIAAQNKLSEAESELKTASIKIKSTETSQSLSELVENAEAGFSALENVGKISQEAIDKANEAKMNIIKTAGSIVAIGAAAGGGFLYWRRKKKGKKVKPKEEKKPKESEKKQKKKKFCPKCGSKIKKGSKFCHKCGKKVE